MVRIVVLGKPGAGKSTHAKILAKKLKIKYIEAGDLLRKEAKKGTKIGKLIKEKIDKGEYAPDWITNKLVLKEAKKAKKGFVLSGYPRDEEQAEFFVKNFKVDLILDIDVDDEVIVKRLSSRRVCPKCGRIYNLLFEKPKKDMIDQELLEKD
ncbi:MAG: hypothetical protein B6U78_01200 [Candidatus Aenigmarchaeota archaeon ex4484_224]|nr:MAG: hypothetical protein B6U78_01200 [Candidatus Aenigmarchaeota archaeon ex4484_224]